LKSNAISLELLFAESNRIGLNPLHLDTRKFIEVVNRMLNNGKRVSSLIAHATKPDRGSIPKILIRNLRSGNSHPSDFIQGASKNLALVFQRLGSFNAKVNARDANDHDESVRPRILLRSDIVLVGWYKQILRTATKRTRAQ
jgi:hypothetical protein